MAIGIALGLLLAFASITSGESRADFDVHGDRFIGPELVGVGVQLHPLVYCAPNWGTEVTEQNVSIFEKQIIDLRPQHCRIFAEREWWEPKGDQERKASFFKVLEIAKKAQSTINMTLWHGPYPDPEAAGKSFAHAVDDTIRAHGFDNVKYVTLQNEVNSTKMKPENYDRLYKAFDAELKALKLRDQLKIIGGDLVAEHQLIWFQNLSEELPDILDGYSVHIYHSYRDVGHMLSRLSQVQAIVSALPEKGQKPIYLMEFGVWSANRERPGMSGYTPDGVPMYDTPLAGVHLARYVIESLRRGYVAMVAWEAADMRFGPGHQMHDQSKNGMMAGGDENFRIRPVYYAIQLFTKTMFPGWRAAAVVGEREGLTVACARGPAGQWTLFVLNSSDDATNATFTGLPADTKFRAISWNGEKHGELSVPAPLAIDPNGQMNLSIRAGEVIAVTSSAESIR